MFITAYIAHQLNGIAAAKSMGCSDKNAATFSRNLLAKPRVKELIAERLQEIAAPLELTAKEVVASLARAIRFDPALMYDEANRILPVRSMPDAVRLELEGVDVDEMHTKAGVKIITTKIRHVKKSVARDQAMRYFGLNAKDKVPYGDGDDDTPAPPPARVVIEFKDARKKGR